MRSAVALAAAVALTLSSSLAFAGGKKAAPPADPRVNNTIYVAHKGGGFTTACDVNPDCNGWAAWLAAQQKKKGG